MADCAHGCLSAPFLGPIRMTMKEYEKDITHNMKRTEGAGISGWWEKEGKREDS